MRRLSVVTVVAAMVLGGAAAAETSKQEDCAFQGAIVGALAQAKIDRVPENKATDHVIASATWPEKYNRVVPIFAGEIYKLKRRDLRKSDQGALWEQVCLAN